MSVYEKEEDAIIEAYNRGDLTMSQMQRELSDLRRSYRENAEEAARECYQRELDRW